jgi:hypothetical protein
VAQGSAGLNSLVSRALGPAVACVLLLGPAQALGAGPNAIAVDSDRTSYLGFDSGAITRVSASGSALPRWTTPVGDADGSLGPIMAIDVGASESNPNGRNVWILDANRRVQEFTRDGTFVRGFRLQDCEGGNVPEPGREGGIAVTHDQIYVAHPCGNKIFRYATASLPATGTSAAVPAATNSNVFAPHGIAGPDSSIASSTYQGTYIYVALPKEESIRWFDPLTLAEPPEGNPVPCLSKNGPTEDVYLLNSAGSPRLYFSDSANDDVANRQRIFAAQASSDTAPYDCELPLPNDDRPFDEAFNFGGLGSGPGQFNDPVAFDVVTGSGPPYTHVVVAIRGNQRIQRVTAQPDDNGGLEWQASAPDPGPPPSGGGAVTGGGSTSGGGGSSGGTSGSEGGTPRVTIDGGAAFTRSANVTLTVTEPAGTTAVDLSNSSDFAGFERRALEASRTYSWTLDTQGSDRVPKRVNVRFAGTTSDPVFDEITLDRRAPLVGDPTVEKRRKKGKKPRWLLRVPASDEVSGLDRLEYGPERDGEYKSRAFKSPLRLEDRSDALYVRVTDVAGNVSGTKRVLRAR